MVFAFFFAVLALEAFKRKADEEVVDRKKYFENTCVRPLRAYQATTPEYKAYQEQVLSTLKTVLVRAKCFGDPAELQLRKAWLAP
ncbi:hypothetical protein J5N97_003154 [Dioscorea zingiberensis]|uniref:Uncharacterized protein n=1 Tax=Dioscorea zingiberensis TaxID=325984 RepID=A0A9D5HQ64_9LILI|nr:hypothetical protein J5N97_003154 [Dioscorea zingiberensis]